MSVLKFEGILTNDGWISPAHVQIDDQGSIKSILETTDQSIDQDIKGYAIPGF